jgi:hypothetical protein
VRYGLAVAAAAMLATTAPSAGADEDDAARDQQAVDEAEGTAAEPDGEDEAEEPSLREEVVRYPPTSVRYAIVAGGAGMFGVAYALSAISAAAWPDVPASKALYAPVVGPLIALGNSGCAENDPDCGAIVYVRGVLYVVDTLVQLGGLALVTEGLVMTTEAEPDAPSVSLVPLVTPTTTGVGLIGRF